MSNKTKPCTRCGVSSSVGQYHIKLKHNNNDLVINMHSLCEICTPVRVVCIVDETAYMNYSDDSLRRCRDCAFSTSADKRYFMVTKSRTDARVYYCEQHGMELINDL